MIRYEKSYIFGNGGMGEQIRVAVGMGGQGEDEPGRSKKLQNDATEKQHIQNTSRKEMGYKGSSLAISI